MIKKSIITIVVLVAAVFVAINYLQPSQVNESGVSSSAPSPPQPDVSAAPANDTAALVPAFYESPPSTLPPTLSPEKFPGKTREAYQAAKDIPRTLAQLPCYCHCDRGMGHKSLHSCFEDDHAAHCATCTDEALLAYRLQKQGLTPKQVRERIIQQFSN
jgi:hypothetical protein